MSPKRFAQRSFEPRLSQRVARSGSVGLIQQILVPLDGSPESEKALTRAEQLAREQRARLVLLRAVEPSTGVDSTAVYRAVIKEAMREAEASLAREVGLLRGRSVKAESTAILGPPAATILDYEQAHRPDLVVMATHGRSGLARFAMGSVTDRIVREGCAPVLVVRRSSQAEGALRHALVMLDGSPLAEQALPLVEALAGKPLQRVTLFQAVADPVTRPSAERYLDEVASGLAAAGLETQIAVEVGAPSEVIAGAAEFVDLVVLSTHGRGGLDRLRHGSVAEHVAQVLDKPMLLVRAVA